MVSAHLFLCPGRSQFVSSETLTDTEVTASVLHLPRAPVLWTWALKGIREAPLLPTPWIGWLLLCQEIACEVATLQPGLAILAPSLASHPQIPG